MRSRIAFLFTVTVLLVAADQPADTATKKGPPDLQGTWKLVSLEVDGKAVDRAESQPRLVIKGDKVLYAGAEIARLTVDAATTPKIIDLSLFDAKKVYEGIYSVNRDKLKVCLNKITEGVKERPDRFATKDKENWRLLIFKRVKAKEGDEKDGLTGFVGLALRFDEDRKELVVADVIEGAPAKKAGLRKDDVVLQIAGADVTDLRSAIEMVRRAKPGSKLAFHIRRDGKESDIAVKVGVLPFIWLALLD